MTFLFSFVTQREGRIGVWKFADPCHFFAKSVDPATFSLKSGTALFKKKFCSVFHSNSMQDVCF